MISRITGNLKECDYDESTFESEPIEIPYFENKKLKVIFIETEYEPYLKEADNVLEQFLKLNSKTRLENSQMVYEYYSEFLKHGYCQNLKIGSFSDIWNYVTPNEIIIDWEDIGKFFLLVSCGCAWEEEHGLQLVFKNGVQLTRAAGHDGHYEE